MDTPADNVDNLPVLTHVATSPPEKASGASVVGLALVSADPVSTGYDPYNNPPPPVEKDTEVTGRRLALANRLR